MYSHENYLWGLVAYGLGFLLLLPLMLRFTRFVIPWKSLRTVVLLLFLAVLLTPVKAYNDMYFLAPAWMVALFEFVRPSSVEGSARAVTPIVVVFAGLLLAALAWVLLRRYVFHGQKKTKGNYRDFAEIVDERKTVDEASNSSA